MAEKSAAFSFNMTNRTGGGSFSFSVLKKLLADMRPFTLKIILIIIFSLGNAYTFILIPEYLGKVLDLFFEAIIASVMKGTPDIDTSALLSVMLPAVAVFLLNSLFSMLQDLTSSSMSSAFAHLLRKKMFAKLMNMEISYSDINSKKSVSEIATTHTDILNQSINLLISQFLVSLFCITAVFIRLFEINVAFGALILIMIPCQLFLRYIFSLMKNRRIKVSGYRPLPDISEICSEISYLRIAGEKDRILSSYGSNAKITEKRTVRNRIMDGIDSVLPDLCCYCAIIASVIIGSGYISEKTVSFGTLISVMIYFLKLKTPLSQISPAATLASNMFSSASVIYRFLEWPDEKRGSAPLPQNDSHISIRFDDVSFRYPASSENVVDNISLELTNKGITELSGETGVGKTTFLKLLLGFYLPAKGSITYNGRKASDFDINSYRGIFSVIPQEADLFEMTLKENIIYPDEAVDENKLLSVIKRMGIEEMLSSLPEGLSSVYRPSPKNLSDGQIQLILLARAMYHEKRFIVLDEAFSSVDEETGAVIQNILREISSSCGVIVISHRKTAEGFSDRTVLFSHSENGFCVDEINKGD